MDKTKLVKLCLGIGAGVLAVVTTMFDDKVKSAEMKETISREVAEALSNQVKES